MFIPAYYRNSDLSEIKNFLRKNSFATLVTSENGRSEASHIPIELVEEENGIMFLQGHLSRANPQWRSFSNAASVLAIFQGAHTYISSSWYNHINVPTWNYMAVHIYGKIKIIEGEELLQSLKELVNKYEVVSSRPIKVEELPADMMEKYLNGIVGFRIEIEKIEGKWKMSQNRNKEDFQNVIRELEKLNDENAHLVAGEMKRLKIEE
jgi:transcriptional regulator